MGVYSLESITKYINFYYIIKEKRVKYPFAISTQTEKINRELTGGAFLIFNQEKMLLFDSFGFASFKQFIIENDERIIAKIFSLEKNQ